MSEEATVGSMKVARWRREMLREPGKLFRADNKGEDTRCAGRREGAKTCVSYTVTSESALLNKPDAVGSTSALRQPKPECQDNSTEPSPTSGGTSLYNDG